MVVVIEEQDDVILPSPANNNKKTNDKPAVNDDKNAAVVIEETETGSVMSKDVSEGGFETASENTHSDSEPDTLLTDLENSHPHQQQQDELSSSANTTTKADDSLDDGQLNQKALAQASDLKVEGNALFKDGKFEDALSKYEFALQVAPEMPESVELRSICHANSATCYSKLGKYDETVKECSKALELNPSYIKALHKRGEAYEKLERYEEAITDMKKILELDTSNDQARRNIVRLEPLAREKMEKMKEEMIGKLKDLGNNILGRFGMSVDNFKTVQDPNTGSYSVQFQR